MYCLNTINYYGMIHCIRWKADEAMVQTNLEVIEILKLIFKLSLM